MSLVRYLVGQSPARALPALPEDALEAPLVLAPGTDTEELSGLLRVAAHRAPRRAVAATLAFAFQILQEVEAAGGLTLAGSDELEPALEAAWRWLAGETEADEVLAYHRRATKLYLDAHSTLHWGGGKLSELGLAVRGAEAVTLTTGAAAELATQGWVRFDLGLPSCFREALVDLGEAWEAAPDRALAAVRARLVAD